MAAGVYVARGDPCRDRTRGDGLRCDDAELAGQRHDQPVTRIVADRSAVAVPPGPADADGLVEMLLKPALYGYICGAPQSESEARNRVERWTNGSPAPEVAWLNYLARGRDDQRVIGLAQAAVSLDGRGHAGECLLAYLVDPAEQGQGFGAEMMHGFLVGLRAVINPDAVVAHIHPGHVASERVAQALGMSRTDGVIDGEHAWQG